MNTLVDQERSLRCKKTKKKMLLLSANAETKQEGSVNCHVYMSYLRAGVGLILGIFLLTFIFGIREAVSIYYSWWIAKWSDDESHRYRSFNNCTEMRHQKINIIRSMSDIEWNNYRNERFYFYCGL